MKKLAAFLLIFGFLISGCSFDVQMVTPAPTMVDNPSPTSVIAPIVTPVVSQTDVPTHPPTLPADAFFHDAFFTLDPVNGAGQWTFPAGTKQLFVVWDYQNMQAGMTVKREWLLNGQPWLTREEPWDFAKYGSSGTMRDISIYDNDIGLPSGSYELRLSVNNFPQPIGMTLSGSFRNWGSFEILPTKPVPQVYSYDTQWNAAVLDGKTLILHEAGGQPILLFNGREILSVTWLPDNQHIVFVDRDRSHQQGTTTIGIRDDLWLIDIRSYATRKLYESPTMLGEKIGLSPSPDSRFIVSVSGSGYSDACSVDSHLIVFALINDFQNANVIQQEQFTGIPAIQNGSVYPAEIGSWKNSTQYLTKLSATCTTQPDLGMYALDVSALKATNISTGTATPIVGDLGWGTIHGKITDATTGAPIVGATITCAHNSYTSLYPCSGTAITDASGNYIFANVFFHDTDTIKLTVQAPGYQTQEITQASFTEANLEVNVSIKHAS